MEKSIRLLDILLIGLTPLVLMAYGWYLGQLHQSGYDVAGIFLFFTGVVGFLLAFLLRLFTRKYSWHNIWITKLLTGAIGCGIIYALVLVFARLHG
jgi:drug/metabolite transporter (DMT)-like permease